MADVFSDSPILSFSTELDILRSILYDLADGVIVADREGKFLFFNRAAQSILGIGTLDVPLEQWSEAYGCYLPDGVTLYPAKDLPLARALAGEAAEETEILVRNAGRPRGTWILAKAVPVRNDKGELFGGVVIFRNISKKKRADARFRILLNAVEQTADTIVITDTKGLVEYVNPAFEKTTGYAPNEILGRTPALLKSGVHDGAFYKTLWDTIAGGEVFRATITNRKKSGEIYFAEQTITPIRDSGGNITHFVAVIKDVTEVRKLQEQELQMKLARAVQQHLYTMPPLEVDGFDIAGTAFPADATGGDYFDIVPLPKRCIGISIGDVCGHGLASAMLMAELRAYARAFARRSLRVGEILTLLNSALISDLGEESYATFAFCRLHPGTRTFTYASAGHVPGYLLDAGGGVKQVLGSTDIPLGLLEDRVFSGSEEIGLQPGEILALLTDGITEAERPDQAQFGAARAIEFIREHRQESAAHIVGGLFRAVREFAGGLPQRDDITAVICKSQATPKPGRRARARSAA